MPCHGIDGCFRGDEVNIGYRPYRATVATAIRTGPAPRYDIVVALEAGQGLGRQTVRNPDHDDLPPDRPPQRGEDGRDWIWVYARKHGGSGWIPLEETEPATSPPGRPCRGPAGFDFEPGIMPSKHGPHTSCGSLAIGSARWRRRRCVADSVYLRWSPDGTAFDYRRVAGGRRARAMSAGGAPATARERRSARGRSRRAAARGPRAGRAAAV